MRRFGLAACLMFGAASAHAQSSGIAPSLDAFRCLTPGQTVTLPAGAPYPTIITYADCTQNVPVPPPLLSSPEIINAATDATIAGAPSASITLAGQAISIRKTQAGPWQLQ